MEAYAIGANRVRCAPPAGLRSKVRPGSIVFHLQVLAGREIPARRVHRRTLLM